MGEQGAKGAPISQDCLSYAHHGMCSSTFLHMNIHIQEYAHTASKLTDPPPHIHTEEGGGREYGRNMATHSCSHKTVRQRQKIEITYMILE